MINEVQLNFVQCGLKDNVWEEKKNLSMQVDAPSKMGKPKRTQMKVVRIDPMKCYLFKDLALMRLNPLI